MKGLLIFAIAFVFPFGASAQVEERLRMLFFQCDTPTGISTYYNETLTLDMSIALYRGYKGSALAMIAGTKSGVQEKFNVFSQGKAELETAISLEQANYELRFLRYAIQSEVPIIVGYRGQIKEDLDFLIQGFENGAISNQYWYWQSAIKFIERSDDKSEEQWNRLMKFILH